MKTPTEYGIWNSNCPLGADAPWLSPKLKGVSICFTMLKSALCGNYVNFGVFRLYGDRALDEALNMFIKLLVSIPLKNLLVSCISDTLWLAWCLLRLYTGSKVYLVWCTVSWLVATPLNNLVTLYCFSFQFGSGPLLGVFHDTCGFCKRDVSLVLILLK